jgi:TolB-like protein
LDWTLLGALAAVLLFMGYQQIAPRQTSVDAAASPRSAISLAVLPFSNLSGDPSQEFFSDGMTEEITSALARIPDLRVVARTSAYQFRSQNRDIQSIGQQLNATHFIEGSVRKAGDRVRITAQLIDAEDGTHMWAEDYDREMTDIFATQEDIALAIASALRVPLGLRAGDRLVSNRINDFDSYEQYLRAKALVRTRRVTALVDAAALLEQVVTRGPDFAAAWALLAEAYALRPNYDPAWLSGSIEDARLNVETYMPKAEVAAQRAIQLDPNDTNGYLALALVQGYRSQFLAAAENYSKSLALDPLNPDALHRYGNLIAMVGRPKEALAMRQQLQALEPFVPVFNASTGVLLWLNGQNDAAIDMLQGLDYGARGSHLAMIYAAIGRYGEAADAVLGGPTGTFLPGMVETAARLLRAAPARATSPQTLPRLGQLGFVYLYVGAPERSLEFQENNLELGYSAPANTYSIWHPVYAQLRKTEQFKSYVRNAGLIDYWRAKGWPEFCRPTTGDDFVCD